MKRRMARLMAGPLVAVAALIGLGALVVGTPALAASTATTTTTAASSLTTASYGPANTPTLALNKDVTEVNGAVTLFASGLKYPESFVITIHSVSEVIGHAQSDPKGEFTSTVVIPANIPTGQHTITYTGNRGDTVSAAIEVVQATPAAASSGSGSSGGLAFTGTDAIATAGLGAGAIAFGGLLVLGARRRRRSAWTD